MKSTLKRKSPGLFILFDNSKVQRFDQVSKDLDVELPSINLDLDKVIELIKRDKKNIDKNINFVLSDKVINISVTDLKLLINQTKNAKQYFN